MDKKMNILSEKETALLSHSVNRIYLYKIMLAAGFNRIAKSISNNKIKSLIKEISANEKSDAEYLLNNIKDLETTGKKPTPLFLVNLRVNLMIRILGVRGFFEWVIIAEDESIEDLSIGALIISNFAESEKWTRIASDERLHILRIKREILGMEGWEMGGGGGIRDVIFGANDGLVSILALVAGVYGATTESHPILIAGIAGAIAGAISMGAGAYLSSKTEKEVTEKENRRKGMGIKTDKEDEIKKLIKFYKSKGFDEKESRTIANKVFLSIAAASELSIGEEVGLTREESWPPIKASILTGLSFAIASLIPILPFAFLSLIPGALTAVIASIATLFIIGSSKAIFTRKSWIRSGLEMMIIGILAAAVTYAIGLAIPT